MMRLLACVILCVPSVAMCQEHTAIRTLNLIFDTTGGAEYVPPEIGQADQIDIALVWWVREQREEPGREVIMDMKFEKIGSTIGVDLGLGHRLFTFTVGTPPGQTLLPGEKWWVEITPVNQWVLDDDLKWWQVVHPEENSAEREYDEDDVWHWMGQIEYYQ